jgi:hypothetical protein
MEEPESHMDVQVTSSESLSAQGEDPIAAQLPEKRFFDSREKYLMFCTTTSEKWRVGDRVIREVGELQPEPPSINIFDAGLGDASVLCRVLRGAHGKFPTVPMVVVGKEISLEDVRLALTKMPDRLSEHPQMVVCVTNMTYKRAPGLQPSSKEDVNWIDFPLKGNTAIEFERQIEERIRAIEQADAWDVKHSKMGNPVAAKPAVLVMYREDQRFALDGVLPRVCRETGVPKVLQAPDGYDLVIASQPFRSRATAESKCKNVLLPMMKSLKAGGRLIVVQSTGHDPGMEIVNKAWPGEEPFATPRHVLVAELIKQMESDKAKALASDFHFGDADQFKYELHSLPEAGTESIGTSLLLAAWNAAVYVAQIDDSRGEKVIRSGEFITCVKEVLAKYGQLWFTNEAFVISRKKEDQFVSRTTSFLINQGKTQN